MPKGGNKKVYRIFDNNTKSYVSLGYRNKTSWLVWPKDILDSISSDMKKDWVVEEYQMVLAKKLTTDRNIIEEIF